MSRNKHYARNAKSREMEQILDAEERRFEEQEEEFLTGEEIEEGFSDQPQEKREKPYYMPASKEEMHLGSYEYVWFSSSR